MSNIKTIKNNIKINWIKAVGGLLMILASIIGYKNKEDLKYRKNGKYIAPISIIAGILGVTLLVTELENNFKPLDIEEEEESNEK